MTPKRKAQAEKILSAIEKGDVLTLRDSFNESMKERIVEIIRTDVRPEVMGMNEGVGAGFEVKVKFSGKISDPTFKTGRNSFYFKPREIEIDVNHPYWSISTKGGYAKENGILNYISEKELEEGTRIDVSDIKFENEKDTIESFNKGIYINGTVSEIQNAGWLSGKITNVDVEERVYSPSDDFLISTEGDDDIELSAKIDITFSEKVLEALNYAKEDAENPESEEEPNEDLNESKKKKWSKEVTKNEKWKAPEGFFSKSADDIAKGLKKAHGDLKSAMSSLSFYMNRAGKKLKGEDKSRLKDAKKKLRGLYESRLDEGMRESAQDALHAYVQNQLSREIKQKIRALNLNLYEGPSAGTFDNKTIEEVRDAIENLPGTLFYDADSGEFYDKEPQGMWIPVENKSNIEMFDKMNLEGDELPEGIRQTKDNQYEVFEEPWYGDMFEFEFSDIKKAALGSELANTI